MTDEDIAAYKAVTEATRQRVYEVMWMDSVEDAFLNDPHLAADIELGQAWRECDEVARPMYAAISVAIDGPGYVARAIRAHRQVAEAWSVSPDPDWGMPGDDGASPVLALQRLKEKLEAL